VTLTAAQVWPWVAIVGTLIVGAVVAFECFVGGSELLSLKKRKMRFRHGHASALLYRRLVAPGTVKLSNGAYLASFEITAADANGYDAQGLSQADFGIGRAISQLNDRMVVHMHLRHGSFSEYDPRLGDYPHPVLQWLDGRRRVLFSSGRTYRSRRIVSISWLAANDKESRFASATSIGPESTIDRETELLEEFERELERVETFFQSYGRVRRLSTIREPDSAGVLRTRSELLEHLDWCISGRDRSVAVPPPGQAINGLLAETFRGGFDLRVGNMETRIVTLKSIPEETFPLVFSRLSELKIDYALVIRWIPLSGPQAKKILQGSLAEWQTKSNESMSASDPHSIDMAESARQAMGFLSSGGSFGLVSPFVVIRSTDAKRADEAAQRVVAMFDEVGYRAFRATLTAEDDYFASLPGDGYHGVRKYPLNAVNVANMFSFHEESGGRRYVDSPTLPARTPAISYAISGSGETLYHVHLNDEPRDVFHHFGVGGTGSGKSVSLAHIAAQWVARLPHAGFTGIDRGRSLYRLAKFIDGNFYDVLGENSPGFAIFSDIDDEQNRREVIDILESFVELQGTIVTPARRRALENAMESIAALPPYLRSLKAFYELVQDPEGLIRPALYIYTRAGVLGKTLDCEVDSFATGLFNVVEIGRIFSMSSKFLIPVLTVMFWKARTQIRRLKETTGNFDYHWLFEIDEAHTLLGHPLGQKFLQDLFKMGRKEKMALGLWSNAATDFSKSAILNDILEACKTRFFFKNSDVLDDEKLRGIYGDLGLTRRGIEMLPEMPPYSIMLHQPAAQELQVLRWSLDRAWLAVIGRSRDADNRRLDEFMARYPESWREELLRYEGVDERIIGDLVKALDIARRANESISLSVRSAAS
jgi:type IV secretory pathway VirB4 component